MRIWLIKIGEPVPDGDGRHRLFRTGLIAQILAERGHDVTWWTANFSHQEKRFVGTPDETRQLESNLRLILLRSRGYSTNISWERFADHIQVAARFLKLAPSEPRPDVIACSFPTVELAAAAVRWGRRNGVPVILDLRDLWPEVLLMHMPKSLRGPARLAIAPYFALSEWAFKNADALYAITPAFLQWGLDRASRPARETDRAFWLAYPDREPSQAEIADARAQWADRGVDLSSESFLACYFGSLSGTVDVHLLVRVAEILKQRRSQVRIVICGSGRLLAELQMRAAELASHLSVPGWVDFPAIWTLSRRASVGLAPYRRRRDFQMSIPNKAIEYMSAGLPLMTSLDGQLGELIAEYQCGRVLPPNDPQAWADALEQLRARPSELDAMSARTTALFDERFRAARVYGDYADALESLAGLRSAQAAAQ